MLRSFQAALTVVFLLAGGTHAADDKEKKDTAPPKTGSVTVTKVDASKRTIEVKYTDKAGKTLEKTFQLTEDVRFLDESGRVANLAVFQSGDEVLLVEREGKLREVRRAPNRAQARRVSDTVRTLIEAAEGESACTEDLQAIYDMLRKLDTGKNGKLDPRRAEDRGRPNRPASASRTSSAGSTRTRTARSARRRLVASSRSTSRKSTRTRTASSISTNS